MGKPCQPRDTLVGDPCDPFSASVVRCERCATSVACRLAQADLHVRAHPLPCASMPRMLPVRLHRFWRPGLVRVQERQCLLRVLRERLRPRGNISQQLLLQHDPSAMAMFNGECALHLAQVRSAEVQAGRRFGEGATNLIWVGRFPLPRTEAPQCAPVAIVRRRTPWVNCPYAPSVGPLCTNAIGRRPLLFPPQPTDAPY